MEQLIAGRDGRPGTVYSLYTTCLRCAKACGKNHVVGVAELRADQ
jgi:hypothetical protein